MPIQLRTRGFKDGSTVEGSQSVSVSDGVFTATGTSVVDSGDGTFSFDGTDNGDGTFTVEA